MIPITEHDFKKAFNRQFFFVDKWLSGIPYNVGDIVYYTPPSSFNGNFYKCNVAEVISVEPPTQNNNWTLLLETENFVLDDDIQQAINVALSNFNTKLRWNKTTKQDEIAFGFLVAHFLETNIQSGVGSPTPNQKITGTRVGNVSESFENVNWVDEKSSLYIYTTTKSGCQYVQMVRPLLIGITITGRGITHP